LLHPIRTKPVLHSGLIAPLIDANYANRGATTPQKQAFSAFKIEPAKVSLFGQQTTENTNGSYFI
jgi:hypothetical protein